MPRLSLDEFAPGLWTVTAPLKIAGAQMGTRMTVVRVGDGQLVLIAPCPIDDDLEAAIRERGDVAAIVAPNGFHHFYFLAALERFPDAVPFLAEGVAAKLGQSPPGARPLGGEPDPIWKADLEQLEIPGAPKLNEVVFFHPASRTLILTDFCFHFDPPPTGWTGFFLRLAGVHGKLAVSRLLRSMLKDRASVRTAVDRILEWDFDRIIVTHGENLAQGAKDKFRGATSDI